MDQLTTKEQNRIKSVLTQSRLGLFDTEDKMTASNSRELVCGVMIRCTPDVKKILDVFLCSSDIDVEVRKLFSNIDLEGVKNIAEICSQMDCNKSILGNVAIRTIFGGTEHMPFRGLAYLLPALNMCEQLKMANPKGTPMPKIEFLFMNGAGIVTNALNSEMSYRTTSQFINIARKYINEYHPTLSDNVSFYVDKTFTANIMETLEYAEIYRVLEKKLVSEESLKSDLLEMGERRKAAQNSIKYATLHAFSQDGCVDPNVASMSNCFGGVNQQNSDIIISIGAKPEEKFFKARKLLASEISGISFFTPKKTAQYIANINVPPYSPLQTGELYLDDVVKNPDLIEQARMRDKSSGEYSGYQVPVQKAVESIIQDIGRSDNEKDIIRFMKGIVSEKELSHLKD